MKKVFKPVYRYSRVSIHPPQRTRSRALLSLFRHWTAPHKRTPTSSMASWRYEREFARMSRTKPRRTAVGMARAATQNVHLFHGAHHRAEWD